LQPTPPTRLKDRTVDQRIVRMRVPPGPPRRATTVPSGDPRTSRDDGRLTRSDVARAHVVAETHNRRVGRMPFPLPVLPLPAMGFTVADTCIACDTCRQLAPATFAGAGDEVAHVRAQPADDVSRHRAILALISCP